MNSHFIRIFVKTKLENMQKKTLTEKAVNWFDGLSIQEKDRLQYELSTPLNYNRWGNKLKVELYKRIEKI